MYCLGLKIKYGVFNNVENKMAKGKKCPDCGHQMYAEREDNQPKGVWVYYKCRNGNCNFTEKVFESK